MAEMGHKPQLEPPWSLPHVRSASNSYHKIVQRSVRSRAEAEGADHRMGSPETATSRGSSHDDRDPQSAVGLTAGAP